MISKIDTIQISTNKNNIKDISIIKKELKPYVVKTFEREECIFIALHFSQTEAGYNYSNETYTFEHFKERLDYIYKDLQIINTHEVRLDRVDYCFDYIEDFESMYKINNVLLLLYAIEIKAELKNIIEVNQVLDQQATSMTAYNKSNSKKLYIYNKKIESDDKHYYNSRQEFRQLKLSISDFDINDIVEVVKTNIALLDKLIYNFDILEQVKIKFLYELYLKELSERKINSFSAFVTRYNEQISTRKICKELYRLTGHEGNFNNWLKKYRKKASIKFVNKTEIANNLKEMKQSIREFLGYNQYPFFNFF